MAVRIDEATHRYYEIETGRPVEGFSEIAKAEGLRVTYQENPRAAEWGRQAHAIVRACGEGTLTEYPSAFEPWMVGIRNFFNIMKPVGKFEKFVHYNRGGIEYAGTLDFTGYLSAHPALKLQPWIIDWKFWASKSKATLALAGIQTAAYKIAEYGLNLPVRRAVVWFAPQLVDGFALLVLGNPSDQNTWLSVLNVHAFKKNVLNLKEIDDGADSDFGLDAY